MNYESKDRKDQIVENPMTYTIKNNEDGTITLTPSFGETIQEGTILLAKYMNNIENGIKNLYSALTKNFKTTLEVDNWILFNGQYEYEIEKESVTANTIVNGILDIDNQLKIGYAYTKSFDGSFKIITLKKPAKDINITFQYYLAIEEE